jgi:HAD superfamily hydrolase (TIGR01509 family)
LLKQGEVEALAKAGFSLTEMDCIRLFSGVSGDMAASNFLNEMKAPLPDNFIRDQIAGSMDLFRARLVPLMQDTVKALHTNKVAMCVASGSPRERVLLSLEVGRMNGFIAPEHVFTRELVSRGKPAPDLFLYAAEKMGIPPHRCIVVEDAGAGIEAAKAANMDCIAFLGGGHAKYDWYQEKILSYGIPTAYTQADILKLMS